MRASLEKYLFQIGYNRPDAVLIPVRGKLAVRKK